MKDSKEAAPRSEVLKPDLCVIGAGSAGLSVAAVGVALGASIVLVGNGGAGGERSAADAVRRQALIAAARRAHSWRQAGRFGVGSGTEPQIDFARVQTHVKEVEASLAPMSSLARYRAMGIRVITAEARFADAETVVAGGNTIKARRFVIATGSQPSVPDIPGFQGVPYLTEETLFGLPETPGHLVVVGGGPTGVEMAQAFRRLGAGVTLIETTERILAREDAEMAAIVERALRSEGVAVRTGAAIARVERRAEKRVAIVIRTTEGEETVEATHLLVAAGRTPVTEGLGLDAAGIELDASCIKVDQGLRTTNSKVYAIGDCAGGAGGGSAHAAIHHAGLVVRNALLRLPVRSGKTPIPRVVGSDPELAVVGMTEEEARARHAAIRILRWPFSDNDCAVAERGTTGHVKAIVTPNGEVLGCTIVGHEAGELIMPWNLAMANNLNVSDLAGLVYPYPTLSEATRTAAVEFMKPMAQNPWVRRLVGFVRRLG